MAFPKTLPRARILDPTRVPRLRWGICGPGWIAERFVSALKEHTSQEILGVQSRDPARAKAFAEKTGIPKSFAGNDMMADPKIDVVYVATVHPQHLPDALAAIEAGKHVLVEKPLAINASEARQLKEAARRKNVFLMEAFWSAFLPKFDIIRQLLADGALGSVRTVIADHGESFPPEHRIMRSELAGGPMLDLRTYPVAFATPGPRYCHRRRCAKRCERASFNHVFSSRRRPGRPAHHNTRPYAGRRRCLRYGWNAYHPRPLLHPRPLHGDCK
jgi:hypothetical protein